MPLSTWNGPAVVSVCSIAADTAAAGLSSVIGAWPRSRSSLVSRNWSRRRLRVEDEPAAGAQPHVHPHRSAACCVFAPVRERDTERRSRGAQRATAAATNPSAQVRRLERLMIRDRLTTAPQSFLATGSSSASRRSRSTGSSSSRLSRRSWPPEARPSAHLLLDGCDSFSASRRSRGPARSRRRRCLR